jgi:hypothetical protein
MTCTVSLLPLATSPLFRPRAATAVRAPGLQLRDGSGEVAQPEENP